MLLWQKTFKCNFQNLIFQNSFLQTAQDGNENRGKTMISQSCFMELDISDRVQVTACSSSLIVSGQVSLSLSPGVRGHRYRLYWHQELPLHTGTTARTSWWLSPLTSSPVLCYVCQQTPSRLPDRDSGMRRSRASQRVRMHSVVDLTNCIRLPERLHTSQRLHSLQGWQQRWIIGEITLYLEFRFYSKPWAWRE